MKIVLVDWAGYPLMRKKTIVRKIIRCGVGRILKSMNTYRAGLPFKVILIVNTVPTPWDRVQRRMNAYCRLKATYSFIESVHFRDNEGWDIGAYDFGYKLLLGHGYTGDVVFMNSSVSGPHKDGWLQKVRTQFRRHENVGLCGISMNSHNTVRYPRNFAPHVQSFFLFSNMQILKTGLGSSLLPKRKLKDRLDIIERGEIRISTRILNGGFAITSAMFPDFTYRRGDAWTIPWGDIRYTSVCPNPNEVL